MTHPTDKHVGERIREMRRIAGITQEALGAAIGVRFQQVQKYEAGANRISASRLHDVAKALRIPVSHFFDGVDDIPDNHIAAKTPQEMAVLEAMRASDPKQVDALVKLMAFSARKAAA